MSQRGDLAVEVRVMRPGQLNGKKALGKGPERVEGQAGCETGKGTDRCETVRLSRAADAPHAPRALALSPLALPPRPASACTRAAAHTGVHSGPRALAGGAASREAPTSRRLGGPAGSAQEGWGDLHQRARAGRRAGPPGVGPAAAPGRRARRARRSRRSARPDRARQVVAHALDHHQPRAGIARAVARPPEGRPAGRRCRGSRASAP